MDKSEIRVCIQHWCDCNGSTCKEAGLPFDKIMMGEDNGKLLVKYFSSVDGQVSGISFIIEYDYGEDLYNVTVQKFIGNKVIEQEDSKGLFDEALVAKVLAYDILNKSTGT